MSMHDTIAKLISIMPKSVWTTDVDIIAPYLEEWRGRWQGNTPLLLLPNSVQEIAKIVKVCAHYQTPITVQGGNTGLVGGQIPQGEILLSTKKLNTIRAVNTGDMSLVCEAGVTLLGAQQAAITAGLKFPLSLASQGSCTIGGNLSTNAGGVHVLKYGTARNLAYGVEAVLPNGDIFNGLTSLRKDNTGYDLSQLLLGAEGTLGIITAASLKLFAQPQQTVRVIAAVSSPKDALLLLNTCRIGSHLSMFELIPNLGMEYVTTHIANMRSPFKHAYPWYVLLDWEFDMDGQGQEFAETILGKTMEEGLVLDAVIAASQTQQNTLLSLRENLSAAQKPIGATIKHDISVPISDVPAFINLANKAVLKRIPNCRPLAFGHLGDGNIHYNIGQPIGMEAKNFMAQEPVVNTIVYDIVGKLGGSISAEHGIGILKKQQLLQRGDIAKLKVMKTIKTAIDPNGIMNPRILF